MEVNTYGAIRMAQRFVPLMLKNGFGRIMNISSGMGQLSEMNGGWPGYRISKTGLNAVTRILADELLETPITVVSICPGWVKTDLGGKDAELEASEAVKSVVQSLLKDRQTGVFLRFGERIDW
jgi:NAD(P)-dependent dehydrogenase (short-subunit alcohol dehydrogenase family)